MDGDVIGTGLVMAGLLALMALPVMGLALALACWIAWGQIKDRHAAENEADKLKRRLADVEALRRAPPIIPDTVSAVTFRGIHVEVQTRGDVVVVNGLRYAAELLAGGMVTPEGALSRLSMVDGQLKVEVLRAPEIAALCGDPLPEYDPSKWQGWTKLGESWLEAGCPPVGEYINAHGVHTRKQAEALAKAASRFTDRPAHGGYPDAVPEMIATHMGARPWAGERP